MPYSRVSDLPAAQVKKYSGNQRRAFMHAFNSVYDETGSEERAFKAGHAAAKNAGKNRPKLKKH